VSCPSAGNCTAGGYDGVGAFAVTEKNGSWQIARSLLRNGPAGAEINSVSCTSAGNCTAGGSHGGGGVASQAWVISQVRGVWGKARLVAVPLNIGGEATVSSVSCASAGNCAAVGTYGSLPSPQSAFVVSQVNGRWGEAEEVPGLAALNTGEYARIHSVSCASPGQCSTGGYYVSGAGHAFVVSES
jgi:hypothetical protein